MTTRTDIAQIRTTDWLLATRLVDVIGDTCAEHGLPGPQLQIEYGLLGITIWHQPPAGQLELGPDLDEVEPPAPEEFLDGDQLRERYADFLGEDAAPEDPQPEDGAPQGPPSTATRDFTCPACAAELTSKRAVGVHIHTDHWDGVRTSWARDGINGIVADWHTSNSTARAWAKELDAAGAKAALPAPAPAPEPDEPTKPAFPDVGPIARLPVDQEAARNGAAAAL